MATPKTLQQAILFFSDYANCHRAVSEIRWPDGVVRCPHCGSENVTYMESARRWKCYAKHAKPQFSLKVGTIFEDSAIPLQKWLPALWLLTTCKNGISSYELARALHQSHTAVVSDYSCCAFLVVVVAPADHALVSQAFLSGLVVLPNPRLTR